MKRFITFFIAIVMAVLMLLPITSCSNVKAKGTVYYSTPAIAATQGEKVSLREYKVEFSMGVSADNNKINWSSEEIEVKDNKVRATKSGVYKLVAEYNGYTKNVYLLVKDKGSDEYAVYSNSFDSEDLSSLNITEQKNGNVTAEDGCLTLNGAGNAGSSLKVFAPSYVSEFGDYKIVMDVSFPNISEQGGNLSIITRYDEVAAVNYKVEINNNAASDDSIILTYNNSSRAPQTLFTAKHTQDITEDKKYRIELNVNGFLQELYIDGNKVAQTEECNQYAKGNVGLKVCGMDAYVDELKVLVEFDKPADFIQGSYLVRNVDSNIVLPPAMLYEVQNKNDLKNILKDSPAVAVMTINADGNVVDDKGAVIDTMPKAIQALGGTVIPAFRVNDDKCADALISGLEALRISDVMVISDKGELISKVRKGYVYARGILDFSDKKDLTFDDLGDIRSATNKSLSRICLLPSYLCTSEAVDFLTALVTTVWVKAEENTKAENYRMIISGATGIMTKDRKLTEKCICDDNLFLENSIVRPSHTVGHRGIPSKSQENTVEGSILAAQNGAKIVENDLYLTKDNVIVIMHNDRLEDTTNGTGSVYNMTYEEISQYMVVENPNVAPLPIPRLEDYFIAFKDTDVNIFLEVKTGDLRLVPILRDLIEQYDMMDQCCVISFNVSQLAEIRRLIPELSVGFLTSKNSIDLESIFRITAENDSTYNPYYAPVTNTIVRACAYRGITLWPWTVNGNGNFNKSYLMGLSGITTDAADLTKTIAKFFTTDKTTYTVTEGDFVDPKLSIITYAGKKTDAWDAQMIIIDGDNCVEFDGLSITGIKKGSATVVFRCEDFLPGGTVTNYYTQPIEIIVE